MKIELCENPSYPRYSVLVDGLWDCDCASMSLEKTIAAAGDAYPGEDIIGFDDPRHYSQEVAS